MTVADRRRANLEPARRHLYRRRERLIRLAVRAHELGRHLDWQLYILRVCDCERVLNEIDYAEYLRDWPRSELAVRG